jgi:hypothetical protein
MPASGRTVRFVYHVHKGPTPELLRANWIHSTRLPHISLGLILVLAFHLHQGLWNGFVIDCLTMPMRVRLRLRTAATKGPIVHPPGDIWACENHGEMMMLVEENSWLLWETYQQSHLGASRRNRRKEWEFYIVSFSFKCRKFLWHGASGFTSRSKDGVLRIFITIKNLSSGFEPATLGSSGKHTYHYTVEATKASCIHTFWLKFFSQFYDNCHNFNISSIPHVYHYGYEMRNIVSCKIYMGLRAYS